MLESGEREILLENNEMLHKLLRAQRWATAWSVLRWVVIIGLSIGGYYYFQPYLDQMFKVYQDLEPSLKNISGILKPPV